MHINIVWMWIVGIQMFWNINIIHHQHVFLVRDVAIDFFFFFLNMWILWLRQLIQQFLCDIRGLFWTCQPIPPPNHSSLHCHMHSGCDMRFFYIYKFVINLDAWHTDNQLFFSKLLSGLFEAVPWNTCIWMYVLVPKLWYLNTNLSFHLTFL